MLVPPSSRPPTVALLALVLGLGLTGCGDDPRPAARSASSTATPTPSATPTASATADVSPDTPAPTAVAPTATGSDAAPVAPAPARPADPLSPVPGRESAAPVGQPPCRVADLTVVDADTLVLEQVVHEVFVVRTTGADCQLEGYPAVRLTDAAGAALPVTATPGGNGLTGSPAPVTLSAGTSLSFVLSTPRDGACVDAAGAEVTLPGTTTPLRTATALPVCGGSLGVSPVLRRTDEE